MAEVVAVVDVEAEVAVVVAAEAVAEAVVVAAGVRATAAAGPAEPATPPAAGGLTVRPGSRSHQPPSLPPPIHATMVPWHP